MSAPEPIAGRVVRLGDDVNTDVILPGAYLNLTAPAELAEHLLETYDPPVAHRVGPGTVLVAGRAFGGGSSREQAVVALTARGVVAVVAASFHRIFFRNAVNLGLPVIECPQAWQEAADDEHVVLDLAAGALARTTGGAWSFPPPAPFVADLLSGGGLEAWTRRRLSAGT